MKIGNWKLEIAMVVLACIFFPTVASAAARLQMPPNYLVTTSGLVGYWTFDGKDTSWNTNTTNDLSGQANTGTMTNMSTTTSPTGGKIGQGLLFDGTNEYVDIGAGPSAVNSISFWVYPETTTEYFVNLTSTTDYIWVNAGTVTATGLATPTIYVNGIVSSTVTARTWQHVVVTTGTAENASNLDIARTSDTDYLEGKMDEVRLYNRALSAAEALNLYNSGAGRFNKTSTSNTALSGGLIAHWTLDGKDTNWNTNTTNDLSGQANTGTMTNMSTTTSPVPGKIGQGLLFDGSNDCIDAGSQAILDSVTTGTFSFWVYATTTAPTSARGLVGKDAGGTNTGDIQFVILAANHASFPNKLFLTTQTAAQADDSVVSDSVVTLNSWNHVVGIFGGAGKSMYVNGVQQASTTGNTQGMANASAVFSIGALRVACTTFANVRMDDVRVYNRALSATEILDLYNLGNVKLNTTSRANTALTSGLVGHWTFDGKDTNWNTNTTNDLSGQSNTGTMTNMSTTTSPVPGKIGQGFLFDGSDDFVNIGDVATLDFSDTADFTISGWFNRATFATKDTVVAKNNVLVDEPGYILAVDEVADTLRLDLGDGVDEYRLDSTTTFTSSGWNYFAVVWDQDSAANSEIYINGVADNATDVGTIGNVGDISNVLSFRIGARPDDSHPFDGSLDDVRIYNRALSASEILQLYNLGR